MFLFFRYIELGPQLQVGIMGISKFWSEYTLIYS